jgi:hypothetical protein
VRFGCPLPLPLPGRAPQRFFQTRPPSPPTPAALRTAQPPFASRCTPPNVLGPRKTRNCKNAIARGGGSSTNPTCRGGWIRCGALACPFAQAGGAHSPSRSEAARRLSAGISVTTKERCAGRLLQGDAARVRQAQVPQLRSSAAAAAASGRPRPATGPVHLGGWYLRLIPPPPTPVLCPVEAGPFFRAGMGIVLSR